MIWFFENDHVLTVKGLIDNRGEIIDDALVSIIIIDNEGNELCNKTLVSDGGGEYSISLEEEIIPKNRDFYQIEIKAVKGSMSNKWVDSLKSQTRRINS